MTQYRLILFFLFAVALSSIWFIFKYKHDSMQPQISIDSLSEIKNCIPVAIIGSGPAGLSAALYAARMNLYTVVFKGSMPGGQLTNTSYVENWPGVGTLRGPEIMKKLEGQAESFGAQFVSQTIERVDMSSWPYTLWTDENQEIKALSVIISTGSKPKRLNIEGEEEFWGNGITTCAICDAPFYKDRAVAVVGGGDSAAEQAMELAAVAKSVTLLVRGKELRASAIMRERLKGYPAISIRYETSIKRIIGADQLKEVELSDGSLLPIEGLFLAIGNIPNTQLFKNFIKCDEFGSIMVKHPSQATSKPGVFAAGDVADFRYRQAGVASGDGIKAALDAAAFLREIGFNETVSKKLEEHYFDAEKDTQYPELPAIASSEELDELLKKETKPVVLDFYAPYCPSCMHMMPTVLAVASKTSDAFTFVKVDTSLSQELAKRFDVTMIPAVLVINQSKLVSRTTEVMNKRQFMQFLQKSITSTKSQE